jgi:hypothetical protein
MPPRERRRGGLAADPTLAQAILDELVFERVRVTLDTCELMAFEMDLAASVERALLATARSPAERSDLTLAYMTRAWDRLGREVTGRIVETELGGGGGTGPPG